jgi:hypothetical protein
MIIFCKLLILLKFNVDRFTITMIPVIAFLKIIQKIKQFQKSCRKNMPLEVASEF